MSFSRTLTRVAQTQALRRFRNKFERAAALARCRWFGAPNPGSLFDSNYYLSRNPDIRESGIDPLFHYVWFGAAEGRQPNPLFDGTWYLSQYPDVAASGSNPLLHFLKTGAREGRRPHPLFDCAYYVSRYPDVAQSGINPLEHFLLHGCLEGRIPNEEFSPEDYLAANPDVALEAIDPVFHFATRGVLENRPVRPDGPGFADADFFPAAAPAPALSHPPAVDVIVPVYKGLAETRACLESVRAARCVLPFRLVAINDASPEPELAAYLREQARAGRFELVENERNLGFVRTVNAGMSLGTGDVVLLNSDTLVFDGWLDRLARCAHSGAAIGTVTPFSNNATICSYPNSGEDNVLPPGLDPADLDRDFAKVNSGRTVDLPTAVGFCMYIRRDCLTGVGEFDAAAFGAGYGEENDFCMRAAQRGWRNVLACDVFVHHAGGVSFDQVADRQERAMKALLRKHPRYLELVSAHVRRDPAKPFRAAVAAYRVRNSGRKVFLSVSHVLGGGVEQHIEELAEDTRNEVLWLHLKPAGAGSQLECREPVWRFSARFDALHWRELVALLGACGVQRIHIHQTIGFGPWIQRVIAAAGVPFEFSVHDYHGICPQVNLCDEHGHYCGEPDAQSCDRCIERRPGRAGVMDIVSWRHQQSWLFGADQVRAPTADTADRIRRYYPGIGILPAGYRQPLAAPVAARVVEGSRPLHVAVLGVMAIHKGFQALQECAAFVSSRGLPVTFTLIGPVEDGLRKERLCFAETGAYRREELPELFRKVAPDLVWFPARWPETFSYTLSTCLELGLPVAVPDLGAFPERVSGRAWSWVRPHDSSPRDWAEFFVSVRSKNFAAGVPPEPPRSGRRFVPDVSETSSRDGALPVAAVVSSFEAIGQIQACGYVRVVCPLSHPALSGAVRLRVSSPAFIQRSNAGAILVQRFSLRDVEEAEELIDHCGRAGIRLIYETDDDLFSMDAGHVDYAAYAGRLEAARLIASQADVITAATAELVRKLKEINPNVRLLPNYLDERLWLTSPPVPVHEETIRLVYAGTITHRDDLQFLGEAVRRLKRKSGSRVELDVVGVSAGRREDWYNVVGVPDAVAPSYPRYARWFREQVVRHGWQWGLAPLLDTPFNRCKSAIKVLEYAAAGLPAICSDGLPYSEFVANGDNGVLVPNDPDAWADALHRAVNDREHRRRIAAGAAALVAANTLAANAGKLLDFWREQAAPAERAARPKRIRTNTDVKHTRTSLAQLLKGEGLEIGALQRPLVVTSAARVRYVDRLTLEQARREYSELGDIPLVNPDIIDDAQTLFTIGAATQDFVIANHVLEHMPNPVLALQNWVRVLKREGLLFLVVPDQRNPLDKLRPVTALTHIHDDYRSYDRRQPETDAHYREYAFSVFDGSPESYRSEMAAHYKESGNAIHFHTFTRESFGEFVAWAAAWLGLEARHQVSLEQPDREHIALLRKL